MEHTTIKWYRIRLKDGSVTGWSRDYKRVKESAEFFGGTIEEK